jgi:membrane fusion protein (multidrug efflux system)
MSTTDPSPLQPAAAPKHRRRRLVRVILPIALVVVAAVIGLWYFLRHGYVSTDDAFVAADVYQINAKVPGRVATVLVHDNEAVQHGQPLAELEAADYQSRVAQAEAAVALAEAQRKEAEIQVGWTTAMTGGAVTAAEADAVAAQARLEQANADLAAAGAEANRTAADRERYQQLSDKAVSRQRLTAVEAEATASAATLQAARQKVGSAQAEVAAAQARVETARADQARSSVAAATLKRREAELRSAQAALTAAQLDLSYTRITAPAAGHVTRKTVLPGTYVQPGQALMAVVGLEVWVEANYKETQLEHMRPGQPASVRIDAYGIDLPGHVDSIQSGSGAAFSLLPPENATGNYVKVVQRVPVKIRFEQQPDARYTLGPGMSVVPEVDVR